MSAQAIIDELLEYFEGRADASMEPGEDRFHGNREMALLQEVQKLEKYISEEKGLRERAERELEDCNGWRMRVHDALIARRIMRPEHLGAPMLGVADLIAHARSENPNPSGLSNEDSYSPGEPSGPVGLGKTTEGEGRISPNADGVVTDPSPDRPTPIVPLTVNRDVLDALLLARRVLRRWTELYAEWSQANGHMEALFDRRLPPADHIKAQEAVQAALNSTCEERTYVGGMEERAAFREAILAGIGAINAGHYERAKEILREPLRVPDQPRTILYSEVSDPTNFNPTGGVIDASTETFDATNSPGRPAP